MEISKQYNSVPIKDSCALFAPTPYFRAQAIRCCHLNFSPADPCCHGNKFWDKIDYNSAPMKDNCAKISPTSLFSGPRYPMVSFEFLPWRPLSPWQWILGQKLTTTRPSWKIIEHCFYLHPYFWDRAIRWCHLNFSPADPHCYSNEFWDKIDYNLAPTKDNCTLFSHTPYFRARAMQWCHVNFSHEDPCCHGNQPFLFKDKTGCRLTRA